MNCKEGTKIILKQIIEVLDALENETYQKPLPIFNSSTLGSHFRHILDFYKCLIDGISKGYIDYDKRERSLLVETDIQAAKSAFQQISIDVLDFCDDIHIEIKADFTHHQAIPPVVKSSIGRELLFAYDHAIHHLAMIKMGLRASFPDIEIGDNVGVAPSTIKYGLKN